jgi:hypothetical protein
MVFPEENLIAVFTGWRILGKEAEDCEVDEKELCPQNSWGREEKELRDTARSDPTQLTYASTSYFSRTYGEQSQPRRTTGGSLSGSHHGTVAANTIKDGSGGWQDQSLWLECGKVR